MSKINGKIILINNVIQVSEKFKKQDFVIETDEMYPQKIMVQVTQDKTAMLELYNTGDKVECSINIKGREWIDPNGSAKYFVTLECWAISKMSNRLENNLQTKTGGIIENFEEEKFKEYEQDNDLPF